MKAIYYTQLMEDEKKCISCECSCHCEKEKCECGCSDCKCGEE